MEHHHLHQSQWDKVLKVLNGSLPESTVLTAEEGSLLDELKDIKEASTMYRDSTFDSYAKIQAVKQRLYFSEAALHKTSRLWSRIVAVAAAVAVIVSGVYLVNYNSNKMDRSQKNTYINDIAPGKVGATLTLANGKKISLSDAHNGELAEETGIRISKTADGQVVYEVKGNIGRSSKINTLTTAKGETYILTLPDKSKVWMNAASSLTYSAALNERGQRKVKLSGEAYFEITKDKAHPFIVETEKQTVKVLGTHFNISSYLDEPSTKTTLLEGSVQINDGTILKPGEQANVLTGKKIEVTKVDVDKVIAWKNGRFIFENESIESIMRKLARWYNVEVVFKDDVQDIPFTAFISKYDDISTILDKITYTQNIHFKIEGRRISVMK